MKKKTKRYIIIGILIMVAGILSFFVYQSYAYFKVNYSGNIINTSVGFFGQTEYAYTGTAQEFVVPNAGYYQVELWGAQGGGIAGGAGGYTKGTIHLEKDEVIYIYVGDKSATVTGWNGAGTGTNYVAGGGATDIRLVKASSTNNTIWNESNSLRSRIMVAGGGGGGNLGYLLIGGAAGGLIGSKANELPLGQSVPITRHATGGQQTTGGLGGIGPVSQGEAGSFGAGGYTTYGSGGGSGYYGGGGAGISGGMATSGGGGSSYISGYAGVNSIQQTGGTAAQPLHTNNTLHYSGKYFIDTKMEAGVNTGNGKAKITYVGTAMTERTNTNLNNVRYIKSCINGSSLNNETHWVEIQAIKDGINVAYGKTVTGNVAVNSASPYSRITDGKIDGSAYATTSVYTGIRCVTVDLGEVYDLDEVGLWLYYTDGRRYYNNTLSIGSSNPGNTTTTSLSTVLHTYTGTNGYNETSQGKSYTAWD